MNGTLFGAGIIIGFAIAAPAGPVGVLCAQRTLMHGRLAGLVSGFGAAVADSIFGLIAAFGLSLVADFLLGHQLWIRGVGGAILLALGLKLLFGKSASAVTEPQVNAHLGNFASTFVLTLTNPITILSFAGIFAAFGVIKAVVTAIDAWVLVAGVFVGSYLWWLIIAGGVGLFRHWISNPGMRWVGKVSGLVILVFGMLAVVSVVLDVRNLPF